MDSTLSGQSLGDQMLGLLNMQYTGATNHSSSSNLGALGGSIAGQSPFSASPSSTVTGNITASEQPQQQRVGITVPHHMLTSSRWPMVHQLTTQQQQATDSSATASPAQQSLRNELALQQLARVPAQQAAPGELNNYSLILQYWQQLQQQQHQMQLMHAGQLNQSAMAMPAVAQQEMERRMPHLQVPLTCVPSSSLPYPAQLSAHAGAFFQSRPGITLAQAQIQAQVLAQVQAQVQAQAFAQVQAQAPTPAGTLLSATPAGQEQQPPLHGATHSDTSAANWDAANVGSVNPAFANIYDFTPNGTLGSSGLFAGSTPRASPGPGSATQKSPKPPIPKKTRRRTGLNNVKKDGAVAAPAPTPTKQGRSRSQSEVKSIPTPGSTASMLSPAEVPLAERFQAQTPPVEQMPSPPLQHHIPRRDVLGSGIDRLLAFHSSFTGTPRTLEEWNAVIDEHFVADGGLRLDLGTQSYDVPKSTAGRFYHTFFGADGVISMYVALGPATINALPIGTEFVVAFHDVLITTTYAGGRRVLESGALRAVFASDFRIRLWAFSATDATVCLPRKRPSGHDDAPVRMADATIARNLEWSAEGPVAPPAQKRRKSSNGRQPQEECVLPADSLRHAEVANTAFSLSDLLALQGVHDVSKVPELLDIWASLQSPSPAEVPKTDEPAHVSMPAPPRKRGRKRSTTTSAAPTTA